MHRKGATPAGKGILGVIPGSMASPTFIVSGGLAMRRLFVPQPMGLEDA